MAIAGMVADMSNYTIYTIGDIDFVYTAFNGIALIFSTHGSMNGSDLLHMQQQLNFYKSLRWVLAPTKTMSRSSLDNGVAVLFHCRN